MKRVVVRGSSLVVCAIAIVSGLRAQGRGAAEWTAHLADSYGVMRDVTYTSASNIDLKLDIYAPRGQTAPNAVVIYYHGGGWGGGTKEAGVLRIMPYLRMGFTVVNVEYRGARVALAPAAVEDCRCALLWVVANAQTHRFDVDRIVLTGDSAGSHLALMSGMLTGEAGLDRACPSARGADPKVAAIVNWSGATDVGDLLEGPGERGFAVAWLGSRLDRKEIARRVSPLTYARPGGPAVLTIHGDADSVIPIGHATRLHAELTRHQVPSRLLTVPGGGHGGFTREQNERAYAAILEFLAGRLRLPQEKGGTPETR